MRILQVVAAFGIGGAERVAFELAQQLTRTGEEVGLAAPLGFLDVELSSAVRRHELRPLGRSPADTVAAVSAMRRLLLEAGPDVVHAHNPRMTATVLFARRLLAPRRRPALVATYHTVAPVDLPLAARILRRADRVACVSEAARGRLLARGVPASRVTCVHNAVAASRPLTAEERRALAADLGLGAAPVVSVVGRLAREKEPELAVDVAAETIARDPRVRFLVVGDGPLRPVTEARVRARGIAEAIRFTGTRPDARRLIECSTLMLSASSQEGLSMAALEALAAGVPVVATETDGMRELLGSGGGVVVRERDARALAEALILLLGDRERRARMSETARRLVATEFSVERMTAAYRSLYAAMAGRGQA